MLRAEGIPGRIFYDYDGKTEKDPIKTLGDAGLNAFRVETFPRQCLGPTVFDNAHDPIGQELLFQLDFGCIDLKVKAAQQAIALGMKFQLTINQGDTIPTEWEKYTYHEMLLAVQKETKRQLQPFLNAKIVPDIILLENEGTSGFLFTENSTGHVRGVGNSKTSASTTDKELCGQLPHGNLASYPLLAGFYKGEVQACNEAIKAAGFSTAAIRYGLHSHGQYVQWKEALVHGPTPRSQTTLKTPSGATCNFTGVIPADLLSQDVANTLTIMGFSAYPDPIAPVNVNSVQSQAATLSGLNDTLSQLQGYAETKGKWIDGPFKGQYQLQALGVEYATRFTQEQVPQQVAHTKMMWDLVKGYSVLLGIMWYEPWYCYGDWEGGNATMSLRLDGKKGVSAEKPRDTLKTWGKAAVSPWKV